MEFNFDNAIISARRNIGEDDKQTKKRGVELNKEQERNRNFRKKGALKLKEMIIELTQNNYFKEFLSYVDCIELFGWSGNSMEYEKIIFKYKNKSVNTLFESRHGEDIEKSFDLEGIANILPIFSRYIGDNTFTKKDISNSLIGTMKNVPWREKTILMDLYHEKYGGGSSCYAIYG